jgi:hypothetical protein
MTDARSIDSQRGTPRKPAAGTLGVISWAGHVMDTTRLDVPQWLICTAVALTIVAAAEIRKAAGRQPGGT